MNKIDTTDELRAEYDLTNLQVRKLGTKRKSFGNLVYLEADVIEAFPNAELVNEALRSLIATAKRTNDSTQHPAEIH